MVQGKKNLSMEAAGGKAPPKKKIISINLRDLQI